MQSLKKVYAIFLVLFPDSVHRFIVRVLIFFGLKPSVNPSKQKFIDNKGGLIISADFELAWASRYSTTKKDYLALAARERENIPGIIELSERYNIPITWAVVGHLFLEECKTVNKKVHGEMVHPAYFTNPKWVFEKGDWYDHDPISDYKKDPLWYAPDLIDRIIKSPVKHEIASHSFSHMDFSSCSEDVADSEMQRCSELSLQKGIKLKSMVFPGGFMGNFESLKKAGVIVYRKQMKYDIDLPQMEETGLVSLPHSYMIGKPMFLGKKQFCIFLLKRMIKKTMTSQKLLHLSFHPSMNIWYVENILTWLFSYLDQLRKEQKLNIYTMGQVAEKFLDNERS